MANNVMLKRDDMVTFFRLSKNELNNLPKVKGQLIFVYDDQGLYFDVPNWQKESEEDPEVVRVHCDGVKYTLSREGQYLILTSVDDPSVYQRVKLPSYTFTPDSNDKHLITIHCDDGTEDVVLDTSYTASDGVTLTGYNFTNSGIRDIDTGDNNGQIKINKNGTISNVNVKGLKSAAFVDKGVAGGVAELDASGLVPSSQLPSYVDDVIEGYYYEDKFYSDAAHTTEITGETGKIYVDLDTGRSFRWSGTVYIIVGDKIQSDWNVNDSSQDAYVRNRTHYKEGNTYHQLDGRYIESKGYTLNNGTYEENVDIINWDINTIPGGNKKPEGLDIDGEVIYLGTNNTDCPFYTKTMYIDIVIGDNRYSLETTPILIETSEEYLNRFNYAAYSTDHKVGILVNYSPSNIKEQDNVAIEVFSAYDLETNSCEISSDLILDNITTVPLDYKFMPYRYKEESGNFIKQAGEAFNASNENYNIANASYSHAEGFGAHANGHASHAEGTWSLAAGDTSHAEGGSTIAAGEDSHSEGTLTVAYGNGSHAEGYGSYSLSNISGSGTSYTLSINNFSVDDIIVLTQDTDGDNLEVFKTARITEKDGYNCTTDTVLSSSTITDYTCRLYSAHIAIGQGSHVEGGALKAIGANSHAGGDHTIAGYDNQTVIGQYNENQEDTLFEVGNGKEGSSSNAFMVYDDGRAAVATDPIEDLDITTKQYVDKKTDKIPNKLEYVTHVNTIEQLPQPFDDGEEKYEDMTTPICNLSILNYIDKIKNPPVTMKYTSKYKLNELRKNAISIAKRKKLEYKNIFAYCMKQYSITTDSRFFIWTDNTMASGNTYVALGQVIFNNEEVENEPILIPIFHFKPTKSKPMYIYCDQLHDGNGFVIYPKNSEKIIWDASTIDEYITINTEFIIYPLLNSENENIDSYYNFLAQHNYSLYQTTTLLTNTSGNNLGFIGYENLEETFPNVFSEYSNVTKYNSYWDSSINIGRDASHTDKELFTFDNLGNPDFGFKSGFIDADNIITVGENNDIYYLSRVYQYQQWAQGSGTGGGTWGSITGTITDQTDLIDLVNNSGFIVNEVIDSSYDLNNSKTTGFYYISSSNITTLAHMPGNCTDGWLMVLKSANQTDVKQVFYRKGTINTNDWEMYSRTYFAGSTTWSDWTQYLTQKDALLQINPSDTSRLNIWIETNTEYDNEGHILLDNLDDNQF